MARFMGLRLHPDGRLDAHLEYGTVQLQPTLADLERRPGWYTMDWHPVADPTGLNGNGHARDAPKRSKASVQYSDGHPGSRCGECEHFEKPDRCAKVAGDISPAKWCILFKAAGHAADATPPRLRNGKGQFQSRQSPTFPHNLKS